MPCVLRLPIFGCPQVKVTKAHKARIIPEDLDPVQAYCWVHPTKNYTETGANLHSYVLVEKPVSNVSVDSFFNHIISNNSPYLSIGPLSPSSMSGTSSVGQQSLEKKFSVGG